MRGAGPRERSSAEQAARWGCGVTLLVCLVVGGGCVFAASQLGGVFDTSAVLDDDADDCDASSVAIIRAAAAGRSEEVREALDQGTTPGVRDAHGNSPLACAGAPGHASTVALLLEAGADPDTLARDGDTVVADAVIFCRDEVLELLLDAGADPGESGSTITPLQQAVGLGRPSATLLLVGAGATLEPIDTVELSGQPSSSPCPDSTPEGRSQALRAALDAGSDPNSVLSLAFHFARGDVVAPALAADAEPDLDLGPGGQPFRGLACLGSPPLDPSDPSVRECDPVNGLTLLIDGQLPTSGSTTTVVDPPAPRTPLFIVSWDGQTDAVRALLDAGADPNLLGPRGMTALHAAAGAGRTDVAALLLPVTARPVPGGSVPPSELASRAGHDDLAALLRTEGA